MSDYVAVLTSNKLRMQEIQKVIERANCYCLVCDQIEKFVEVFTHSNIDFYVLDVQDSQGNQIKQFREFYDTFLRFVPSDIRVVIGDENNFIKYENFSDAFVEKIACRAIKVRSYKLMSNERVNQLIKQIERCLIEKKFSPKYTGFEYVTTIMYYYLTSDSHRIILSRDIYPKLCEKYHKSQYCIERNVRFFLQSNKFLDEIVLDGNYSTKRVLEILYRDLKKDVFIQKILNEPDVND